MKKFFIKHRALIKSLFSMVVTAWIMALPTMLLWNDLVLSIDGFDPLNYRQSVSLYFLAGILGKANEMLFDD